MYSWGSRTFNWGCEIPSCLRKGSYGNTPVMPAQSCPALSDLMDYSPPGFSVHGIFQVRIVECVAIFSSRGSSWPRDQNCISCMSCVGRQILYHWATGLTVLCVMRVYVHLNMYIHTHMYISCTYVHMYNQYNYYVKQICALFALNNVILSLVT